MFSLMKPPKLNRGDKVAAVSLSWGGAGDKNLLWRYEIGKKRLQEVFGLEVVEMSNTLKGSEYLYCHPEKRAQDFMQAFENKSIKAIFSCIGGDDSIRMLPYIDFEVIHRNPKIFIGYSDSTVSHFMCLKAGLSSFYGAAVLAQFAENAAMHDYTKKWINKTLFEDSVIGEVHSSNVWTSKFLPWATENQDTARKLESNRGYELLQGTGKVQGRLIGGCMDVLEMIKGTCLWPESAAFDKAILFVETCEEMPKPNYVEYWLRNYGAQGILQRLNGILFGRPYNNCFYEEYKVSVLKVLSEFGLNKLPILYNVNFGHTDPIICLPYGALAEINCENASFTILESGVK